MVSIPKVVGVLSCGCVLGLGLSLNASHITKGEVVRVDPSAYFVKEYDGDQVRVHTDTTTQMTGTIHNEHRLLRFYDNRDSDAWGHTET